MTTEAGDDKLVDKFNVGEWSEPYVVLKLLGDGEVSVLDKDGTPRPGEFLRIAGIVREVLADILDDRRVIVERRESEKAPAFVSMVSRVEIKSVADRLLALLKDSQRTFGEVRTVDTFIQRRLGLLQLKQSSDYKKDIEVRVFDSIYGNRPLLYGFSVKSELGHAPTLLNASGSTRLNYVIEHASPDTIEAFNTDGTFRERFEALSSYGAQIVFRDFNSPVFCRNLAVLDDSLPRIVAEMTLAYFKGKGRTVAELADFLKFSNPCGYPKDCLDFYEIKIKRMLRNVALGMVPATPWDDIDDATGGYLIVKDTGDIGAFYIHNRREFDEYLFRSTILETPSRKKHGYGFIEKEGAYSVLRLALQIRFTK